MRQTDKAGAGSRPCGENPPCPTTGPAVLTLVGEGNGGRIGR